MFLVHTKMSTKQSFSIKIRAQLRKMFSSIGCLEIVSCVRDGEDTQSHGLFQISKNVSRVKKCFTPKMFS